jgi:hypothetical protein
MRIRPSRLLLLALAPLCAFAGDPPPAAPPGVEVRLPFPDEVSWRVMTRSGAPDPFNRYAVDFAMAPEGQLVCAVADGVVEVVKEDERESTGRPRDDNRIVVRHDDGVLSEYLHLAKDGVFFDVGERVVAGDVVGLSGNTGASDGPHLTFNLRKGAVDGASVPCKFVEVADDGAPKPDAVVKSQNVWVRNTPGWRETRVAIDLFRLCDGVGAAASALPLLEAAKARAPKLKHPSVDALLRERDELIEARRLASMDVDVKLGHAKSERDIDALVDLAMFAAIDYADMPALAKPLRAIAAEFGKDPAWGPAAARLEAKTEFRKLVAAAAKEEAGAAARFRGKRDDPKARPDYAAAIVAWERARAKAPRDNEAAAVRRHAESLAKAR